MHKGLEFLTEKEKKDVNEYFVPEGKRNIIFLDIDGVLQPYSSWLRDDHDIDATIKYLCSKYDPEVVTRGDKYDDSFFHISIEYKNHAAPRLKAHQLIRFQFFLNNIKFIDLTGMNQCRSLF